MADKHWVGGSTGSWDDPDDWLEEEVPQDGDDVYIRMAGSHGPINSMPVSPVTLNRLVVDATFLGDMSTHLNWLNVRVTGYCEVDAETYPNGGWLSNLTFEPGCRVVFRSGNQAIYATGIRFDVEDEFEPRCRFDIYGPPIGGGSETQVLGGHVQYTDVYVYGSARFLAAFGDVIVTGCRFYVYPSATNWNAMSEFRLEGSDYYILACFTLPPGDCRIYLMRPDSRATVIRAQYGSYRIEPTYLLGKGEPQLVK